MNQKPTLKVLAEKLQLSTSTVSKALKDSAEISVETKVRVKELAKLMGYRPNTAAASLRNRETRTIAVVLPEIINDFFGQVLMGIEEEASQHNYKIVICISNESYLKEKDYVEMFSNGAVDGFIIAASMETQELNKYEHYNEILNSDLKLVMFDRVIDDLDCDKIIVDDAASGSRLVDFLKKKGDRNLCVASTISKLSVGQLREQGIKLKVDNCPELNLQYVLEEEDERFMQQLEDTLKNNKTDAVIALDQRSGIMTLNKAKELNIKVPQDLQIICYSNSTMAKYSYPQLTVVDQHSKELGKKTFTRIFNLMKNKDEVQVTRIHTLKTTLLERGTTRK
ncbi:transcriptional regulator, LacI family [Flavobacteria bacterium BBFL7]|nr:transcriptional regulator, LacI family [Flavobacteria bacterium BBFL7]